MSPWRELFGTRVPREVAARFRNPEEGGLDELERALAEGFFASRPEGYLYTDAGRRDMREHLTGRLRRDRTRVIPWLASVLDLDGARVLEVGCGTGTATVALAEQGAGVTGLDLDAPALEAARVRLKAYRLGADLRLMDATSAGELTGEAAFDLVVFWACLEHMTHSERMSSLGGVWEALPPGGLLGMVDTPNRLYPLDRHTSGIPFFDWLPDEVAVRYVRFSDREELARSFRGTDASVEDLLRLRRWGRGLSYHDLELALAPLNELEVAGCLAIHERGRDPYHRLRARLTLPGRYEALMRRMFPGVPAAFLQPGLNLVLRKR